jgi:UDP-GlcNAc:undecaprenyl-phosphate/decaprenyl-phosphate GlcNAc-1-phosphate transferase
MILGLILVAATLAVAAALVCRAIALRVGAVCHPQQDRWSVAPVPLLGGPAIVAATATVLPFVPGLPVQVWILLAGAAALSLTGLVDDLRPISPYSKLTAQLVAAGVVTALGLRFHLTGAPVIDVVVTVGWIVGLSNAFNLLDNMDGLAAGIAAIAGTVKLVLFAMAGQWAGAGAAAIFVGASLGFLTLNFHPARIFMGDAGSMFLGFFLAGLSTIGRAPDSRVTISVLVAPVLVMSVPIFDTLLVTILRLWAGRPISQGGRDHTSHRLVTAGLSERKAVLMLYALAAVSGALAVVTRGAGLRVGLALLAALAVAMLILGVTLARIKIYPVQETAPPGGVLLRASPGLPYVRQIATAGIDGLLVLLSYYAAYVFRHGTAVRLADPLMLQTLLVVFSCKMAVLALLGANRRVWRYTNSHDLMALAVASTIGSALFVPALLLLDRSAWDGNGGVFVLDWLLFTGLLAASRLSLRGLSEILRPAPVTGARVLIYGAGDAGVALLHELRNNTALARVVVGFVDDDALKQRTRVQGLPVLGGAATLVEVLARHRVQELIVATRKLPPERLGEIQQTCEAAGVSLSRFQVAIQGLAMTPGFRRRAAL